MSMNDRQLRISKIISVLCILAIAGTVYLDYLRRQRVAQQARLAWQKREDDRLSSYFTRVERVGDKVLLVPTPPSKESNGVSLLLKQGTGYWREPRLISNGFEFGWSDGHHPHSYKVLEMRPDGILVRDKSCCDPPDSQTLLTLRWKS